LLGKLVTQSLTYHGRVAKAVIKIDLLPPAPPTSGHRIPLVAWQVLQD
jgi:hypothetical protein